MRLSELVFDHLYETRGDRYAACVYCGLPSETLDHVPPLDYASICNEDAKKNLAFYKIPSCGECNSALGNILLFTVLERINFIKKYLRKKYAKALRIPYWDEEELKELSRTMRDEIRKAEKQSAWVKDRVTYSPPNELLMLSCYDKETE